MTAYKFVRISVGPADAVTRSLNALLAEGWMVVSHAENSGEYSFVLVREDS